MWEFNIDEVIQSLPHKYHSAENIRKIINVYLKFYNRFINSIEAQLNCFDINTATGDALTKLGNNFLVDRGNFDDEQYRLNIKLAWAVYKISGSIKEFSTVFRDYLNLDTSILNIYEDENNANIFLDINRNNNITSNVLTTINEVITFAKPVGVGFNVRTYSSGNILDTYTKEDIAYDFQYERNKKRYMVDNVIMESNSYMWDSYFGVLSKDSWVGVKMEVIN